MCDEDCECEDCKEELLGIQIGESPQVASVISIHKGPGGIDITVQSSNEPIDKIQSTVENLMNKYGDKNELSNMHR